MTIAVIQGRGHISPLLGQEVSVVGIVTATRSSGFCLQDPVGDGDDATSEGFFVFTGSTPSVSAGGELNPNPGRADPNNPAFSEDGGEGMRKSLAVEFESNGQTVYLVNNHFKSKFGSDPLFGTAQPAEDETAEQCDAQAEVIRDFDNELLEADPNTKIVTLGFLAAEHTA